MSEGKPLYKDMNIYQRINAVTEEIKKIPKSKTIGFGKNSYQVVTEADVLKSVKEAEQKFGIASYPASRKIVESRVIKKSFTDDKGNTTVTESQFMRIETIYRFVNIDKPEEFVETTSYGDGVDSSDKCPGKCASYSDRYALMKTYKIETGDDMEDVAKDSTEGHNIFKVKQRIEEKLTLCTQKGVEVKDILAHVGAKGSSEKNLQMALNAMGWVFELEKELDKRL